MKRILLFVVLAGLLGAGCRGITGKRVSGNGQVSADTIRVDAFREVSVSGAMDVIYRPAATAQVVVEGDENLLAYVEVYTSGSELVIRPESGYRLRPARFLRVYVYAPLLAAIDVSGASRFHSDGKLVQEEPLRVRCSGASELRLDLRCPELNATASGASSAELTGETRTCKTEASGASGIRAFGLLSEVAEARASGASHVRVHASVKLDAHASGASTVEYKGKPSVTQSASGASTVKSAGL